MARLKTELDIISRAQGKLSESLAAAESEKLDALQRCSALEQKHVSQATQHSDQLALLENTKKRLAVEFENLANRIFDEKQSVFAVHSKAAMESTLTPLRRDIGDFRQQVATAYDKENADRNQLIGSIGELQKQTMQISAEAASLTNALRRDNKAQGNWGEFILEKLLEDSGLSNGREYTVQVNLADAEGRRRHPDVVVHLPEGRDIVIDAKVSLKDYESYYNASCEVEKGDYLKKHLNSMRSHIRGLSGKNYEQLNGVNSLDFVLLFVPIDSALLLALDRSPELQRDAYDQGIILASSGTLMVTLRTIKNLWRYADQNRNAKLIAEKAGRLYDQFVLFTESLDEVSKHIERSSEALGTARKRLTSGQGNLIKKTEELKTLGAKAKKQLIIEDSVGLGPSGIALSASLTDSE
ncbi:MAG: DNA recombination protein RmuC [Porticoccaceae bacterium]|nr:DNA recombination protein RmuC [Porticoccaceae bacterium]